MSQKRPYGIMVPIYNTDLSEYPDKMRIPMDDGHVVDYFKPLEQKSVLKEMLDAFDRTCFGGQKYKTKGVGKRTGRRHQ